MVSALVVAAGLTAGEIAGGQVQALQEHLARNPGAAAEDVYKFLHQGVFGPGHMVDDRTAALEYLKRELAGLDPAPLSEAVCEPLGGEPGLVRVHLRPFLEVGGDLEQLVAAFVASANQVRGDPLRMAEVLAAAVEALRGIGRSALGDDLARLSRELEPQGFPALHHSEAFRATYRPAYRVVLRALAEQHGWCSMP